jgi:hypothetical protein
MALRLLAAFGLSILLSACRTTSSATRPDAADTTGRPPGQTSSIAGYTEYYRLLRFNALDQIVLCYPTADPRHEADVVAVARDAQGRPTLVTRYFFGNPGTRGEWTSMRIEYNFYPSTGQLVERRTYHDPNGAPMEVRGAYGQEILFKAGQLTMRRLIDQNNKPIVNVRQVIRSLFKEERPGTIVQEWFFGNGKQYFGIGTDNPGQPFGDMPPEAYFRRFTVNAAGELVREEVWGIEKRAIEYPGGEIVRAYELNECGQPQNIAYLDEQGAMRPNRDGIVREKLRYDDFGRLVEWQAFGETGVPRARSDDGAAAIVFHYRPFDGVLVGVDRFDANGDPLPADTTTVGDGG